MVHQPLDPQPFPEPRQFHMKGALAQIKPRIPMALAMNLPKIAEREAVQVPSVRRIAPGDEVRVVGRHQINRPAGPGHAVNFRHRFHDVVQMLDHMNPADLVKPVISKWQSVVEIANDIGCRRILIGVYPDRPRGLRPAAA